MVTRIGILIWMIVFAVPSSLYALSLISLWQNKSDYGNCEVSEIIKGEITSKVSLFCISEPNEKKLTAWMRITVSKDETNFTYSPTMPRSYGEDPAVVPDLGGETIDGKYVF